MLIVGKDKEIAFWVGERIGIQDFGPFTAIGVGRGPNIVAGAVYHGYRHPNIEMSFASASPRWATKETIGVLFRYPFIQLGCRRVTATTASKNQPARAFLCRLGFTQEGYHPEVFAADDAVTYGMLRKDAARWLEGSRNVEGFVGLTKRT